MKPLTGLPTSDYLKISQEATIQLSDLLRLVQELEAGTTPAYIAHHRPDLSAGLGEEQIRGIEARLRQFLDFEDRRVTILTAIGQQNRLTPELRARIEAVTDRRELEDLYLPFRPKRKSDADEGVEKGLEPLARFLWDQKPEDADIESVAGSYVNPEKGIPSVAEALRLARAIVAKWLGEDAEIRVDVRRIMHDEALLVVNAGKSGHRDKASKDKFRSVVGYQGKAKNVPWRQALAIRRAVKEGAARPEIVLPENQVVSYLLGRLLGNPRTLFCLQLGAAAREAFASHLAAVFQHELQQDLEERVDRDAIQIFKKNLRKLLLMPPGGRFAVIGLETNRPGGCRAAVIGPDGQFLEAAIVGDSEPARQSAPERGAEEKGGSPAVEASANGEASESQAEAAAAPLQGSGAADGEAGLGDPESAAAAEAATTQETETEPAPQESDEGTPDESPGEETPNEQAASSGEIADESGHSAPGDPSRSAADSRGHKKTIETPHLPLSDLIKKHDVRAVVMANGPGIRQVERAIRGAIREAGAPKVFWTAVNDSGSWIYATSKVARHELPDVEPAVRSAACMARRFQDPLAEFIQVDPRILGIGQFHHEVDPKRLRDGLHAAVESTVHRIGVDLNTAPVELLSLVPGLTERLAKRIVERRRKEGPFTRRRQLQEISGLNERIYKQAAGFTRVRGGENVLDATPVHPEHYPAVEKLAAAAGVSVQETLEKPEALASLALESLQDEKCPADVLRMIVAQLSPEARNPRGEFVPPEMPVELKAAGDLKPGMKVDGVVTNIASFGVCVDIGADQDGLVHISRISDQFVKDPQAAAKVGDRVSVHILALEEGGKRISLSLKDPGELRAARPQGPRSQQGPAPSRVRRTTEERAAAECRRSNGARQRRKEPQRAGATTQSFGPDERAKAREAKEAEKLSLDEKLALLQTKYRTKV